MAKMSRRLLSLVGKSTTFSDPEFARAPSRFSLLSFLQLFPEMLLDDQSMSGILHLREIFHDIFYGDDEFQGIIHVSSCKGKPLLMS